MSKKKVGQSKFAEDSVSNSIISKYGDVIRSGTEVLESINSLQIIGV